MARATTNDPTPVEVPVPSAAPAAPPATFAEGSEPPADISGELDTERVERRRRFTDEVKAAEGEIDAGAAIARAMERYGDGMIKANGGGGGKKILGLLSLKQLILALVALATAAGGAWKLTEERSKANESAIADHTEKAAEEIRLIKVDIGTTTDTVKRIETKQTVISDTLSTLTEEARKKAEAAVIKKKDDKIEDLKAKNEALKEKLRSQ